MAQVSEVAVDSWPPARKDMNWSTRLDSVKA